MVSGGKRAGAGRPAGKNIYGETTKPLRVPISRYEEIKTLLIKKESALTIPLYASKVPAGFPSPADDYIEEKLDLNHYLIKHPAATFFVRASGDSMINAGIFSGDILVVDRSLDAIDGKIIIAAINGELTVKRLRRKGSLMQLLPENTAYKAITITEDHAMQIWGVVTHVIHEAN